MGRAHSNAYQRVGVTFARFDASVYGSVFGIIFSIGLVGSIVLPKAIGKGHSEAILAQAPHDSERGSEGLSRTGQGPAGAWDQRDPEPMEDPT
jgi:hypothetical protein